jgi:hypothetical protein
MYKTRGACAMYGVWEKYIVLLCGKLKQREHLENLGINGRVILQWTSNIMAGHTLALAHKWLVVVNLNLRIPQNEGYYWVLKKSVLTQFQNKATVNKPGSGAGPHKVFYCFRISPDLRSVVYCSALINGGEEEWNFLWNQYQNTAVATDQVLILNALGCTTKPDLLNR